MKKFQTLIAVLVVVLLLPACKNQPKSKTDNTPAETRIISLNGAVTEILAELGYARQLAARDVTSNYPDFVRDSVKDLGHVRSLTIEPIMDLHPDLILATDGELSNDLKKSILDSGTKFKMFHQDFTVEGTQKFIREVAEFIGDTSEYKALNTRIDEDLTKLTVFKHPPKVLFIYARGAGTLMVAGEGTQMTQMIEIAGGINAITDFKDFKPLTEEALLSINPDVILLFDTGLESVGGKEDFLKVVPAISQTNAGKNKAIISMDGALLSDFGPRIGQAAYQLNQLLKPYAE